MVKCFETDILNDLSQIKDIWFRFQVRHMVPHFMKGQNKFDHVSLVSFLLLQQKMVPFSIRLVKTDGKCIVYDNGRRKQDLEYIEHVSKTFLLKKFGVILSARTEYRIW